MKKLKRLIFYILHTVYLILTRGMVVKFLWKWFVVGTFKLPELNIFTAYGIGLLVMYLVSSPVNEFEEFKLMEEKETEYLIMSFLLPWLALFIGWVIHLFA